MSGGGGHYNDDGELILWDEEGEEKLLNTEEDESRRLLSIYCKHAPIPMINSWICKKCGGDLDDKALSDINRARKDRSNAKT